MDLELYSMMPFSIGIKSHLSFDAYGEKTYGTLISYPGRIQNKRRKIIDREGHEVISETTLYLGTTATIGMEDQITLPSGYLPLHPEILSIKREADENGAYATTIYV